MVGIARRVGYFFLVWVIQGLSLVLIAWVVPGVTLDQGGETVGILSVSMGAALVLALVNGSVRPVLVLLLMPLNVLTVGLFSLVINALMLMLTSWLFPLFEVAGFGPALGGSLILTVANTVLTGLATLDDDYSYFGRVIRWLSTRQRVEPDAETDRGVVII